MLLAPGAWRSAVSAFVRTNHFPRLRALRRPRPLALLVRSFIGTPRLDFQHCQQEGCEIRASFGSEEDKVRRFCKGHKRDDDIDVVNKRCEHEGCEMHPAYGSREDGIRRLCIKHKGAHHVNVKDNTCMEEGCEKQPKFGLEQNDLQLWCSPHSPPGSVPPEHTALRGAWIRGRQSDEMQSAQARGGC